MLERATRGSLLSHGELFMTTFCATSFLPAALVQSMPCFKAVRIRDATTFEAIRYREPTTTSWPRPRGQRVGVVTARGRSVARRRDINGTYRDLVAGPQPVDGGSRRARSLPISPFPYHPPSPHDHVFLSLYLSLCRSLPLPLWTASLLPQ